MGRRLGQPRRPQDRARVTRPTRDPARTRPGPPAGSESAPRPKPPARAPPRVSASRRPARSGDGPMDRMRYSESGRAGALPFFLRHLAVGRPAQGRWATGVACNRDPPLRPSAPPPLRDGGSGGGQAVSRRPVRARLGYGRCSESL